jgi:hypothetical protein
MGIIFKSGFKVDAVNVVIPTATPTPTPTVTPTASVTPTPTITNTPSPTPNEFGIITENGVYIISDENGNTLIPE